MQNMNPIITNNYKISVITATFNSQKTIKETLNSILSQDYNNIEHIIVDGKSSDKTLQIIESYRQKYEMKNITLKISSQKDSGIYDAFNRGIKLASGDIIGFLNSDDYFSQDNILSIINWAFNKPVHKSIESICANLEYIDSSPKILRYVKGKNLTLKDFKKGFHPAHPTFYVKKEIFEKFGNFNLSYKISGDYELMLRFVAKNKINNLYIDENFIKMRLGGVSNQSLKNIYRANIECFRAWKDNKMEISPMLILLKPLRKIKEVNIFKYIKYMVFRNRGGVESSLLYNLYYFFNFLNLNFLNSLSNLYTFIESNPYIRAKRDLV